MNISLLEKPTSRMEGFYPPPPAIILPSFTHIAPFCGMWYKSGQLDMLDYHLGKFGFSFLNSVNHNAQPRHSSFGDYVDARTEEILKRGERIFFFAHSYGIRSAVAVAERTDLVKGIVCFDPCPPFGVWVNMNSRVAKPYYLRSLVGELPFGLLPQDERYFLDGAKVSLGPESANITRRMAFSFLFGYRIKKLSKIKCRSLVIMSAHNRFLSRKAAGRVASYYNTETRWIEGGHFAHCDERFCENITEIIVRQFREWS